MHLRETLAAGGGDQRHIASRSCVHDGSAHAAGHGIRRRCGIRFRFYSIASVMLLIVFGALTFLDAPRLAANLLTPWHGHLGTDQRRGVPAWMVVLAIAVF